MERRIGSAADWVPCYDQYRLLADEADHSWEVSELVRLGFESLSRDSATRELRELAHMHRARSTVESLLRWDWATFNHLQPQTRERWLDGLLFVFDKDIREKFQHGLWRYAAERFGEAMEQELKTRLFGQFVRSPEFKPKSILARREAEFAQLLGETRASLGVMISTLELSLKSESDLGRQVDAFLKRMLPEIRQHLRSAQALKRLRASRDVRNLAAHDDVSEMEARQIYFEAKILLDLLSSTPIRGSA